ncbi:hypothetical protein LJB98_04595 [Bacteroidales bacterium OttesenSCG-928-M11]|nr:hypothetical protein [Bacteroidales bacterium OttesenSCG-928-M11]
MKLIYFTFPMFFILLIFSCNKPLEEAKEIEKKYNGLDSQILSIIDSIPLVMKEEPIITVTFGALNEKDYAASFHNLLLKPVPHPDFDSSKKGLISEDQTFRGYKKLDSIYVVFLEDNGDGIYEKFINKDSLLFDEEPFLFLDDFAEFAYGGKSGKKKKPTILTDYITKVYLIKNDSLIFFEEKREEYESIF